MVTDNEHKAAEQALTELNVKIGEAETQRDEGFLAGILADDLKFRRANGAIVDKAVYLAGLRDPANTFEYLHSEDVQVQLYETTAVVSLRVRSKGMRGTTPFEGVYRNIRVFLKQPDGSHVWQCHMWFNERIQDALAAG